MRKSDFVDQEIINYLKTAELELSCFLLDEDVVDGSEIHGFRQYRDDKYRWTSQLPYYMEKYNLRLPKEFEDHILRKIRRI